MNITRSEIYAMWDGGPIIVAVINKYKVKFVRLDNVFDKVNVRQKVKFAFWV